MRLNRFNVKKILLYLGFHITIFMISCGLVGYGIKKWDLYQELYPRMCNEFVFGVIPFVEIYPEAGVIWVLGIFGMMAGLLGITDVIKPLIIHVLFRRKHSI